MESKWNPRNDTSGSPGRKPGREYTSRLKPQSLDPLERVGLPSKGDNSLSTFSAQENYFTTIKERCERFKRDSASSDQVEDDFTRLSLNQQFQKSVNPAERGKQVSQRHANEMSTLLAAMRKLREAIVSTSRYDTFAQEAYIYICRTGILYGDMETYHPAMLHLLQVLHLRTPLPEIELEEFIGYRILDLCCRSRDFHGAYKVKQTYNFSGSVVIRVVESVVQGNWILYWRLWGRADNYQKKLMEFTRDHMQHIAISAITKSYFTIDKVFAEVSLGTSWPELLKGSKLAWVEEEDKVVVRRRPTAK